MLVLARNQFALYTKSHNEKAERFQHKLVSIQQSDPEQAEELKKLIVDTANKALVNEDMVLNIDKVIEMNQHEGIQATVSFAAVAYEDGVSDKNRQTQLAVHFEEVGEMLDTLSSNDEVMRILMETARHALHDLSERMKQAEPCVFIKDRVEFLDACCDQIVTSTLSANLHNMDIVGGLEETNRSNASKLVDGKMLKDPVTKKWLKGPNFTRPNLKPFV